MMMDPLCKAARLKTGLIEMGYRSAIAHEALDRLSAGIIFADGGGQVPAQPGIVITLLVRNVDPANAAHPFGAVLYGTVEEVPG